MFPGREVGTPPRRRVPFRDLVRSQQFVHGLELIGQLGDHRIGRQRGPRTILQCPQRVDETAVVGAALESGIGRVEPTTLMRSYCFLGGHTPLRYWGGYCPVEPAPIHLPGEGCDGR